MKIKLINLMFLIIIGLNSCKDMTEINQNLNNPKDVKSDLIITDLIISTSFRVVSGDYNYFASIYTEHNVGIYNQFYNAEVRTTQPQVASTYNNTWVAIYENLYNAKIIIDKCSQGGSEEGNYHTLGIAQIMTAINLATLTDAVGDVPWSEALKPAVIFNPKLDKQEHIYKNILELLENSIENLTKETTFPSLENQDPIFNGNPDNWKKTAFALIARYYLRKHAIDPNLDKVIINANQSFSNNEEQCILDYNIIGGISPFVAMFNDRDYYGASRSLHDKLVDLNDPRADVLWVVHPRAENQNDIVFVRSGDVDQVGQAQEQFSISAVTSQDAPTFIISYHELEFIKAEAYVRKNELLKAEIALKNAVIAAFDKIQYVFDEEDNVENIANIYYNEIIKPRFDENPLKEVLIQKYIAFFEEEAFQIYCDIRRLQALNEDNIIELSHPDPNKFPLRYTYGSSDVTTNKNIENAYANINVYTDNIWWANVLDD